MKYAFATIMLALHATPSLAQTQQTRPATKQEIEAIRTAMERKLVDAASAKFDSVTVKPDGQLCGLVNAKNMMGGYTGYRPFMGGVFKDGSETKAVVLGVDSNPMHVIELCAQNEIRLPPH